MTAIGPDAFLDALAQVQESTAHQARQTNELIKLLEPAGIPVRALTRPLTAVNSLIEHFDGAEKHMRAFTVISPNVALLLGLDGQSASNALGFTIPASSWATIPMPPDGLQIDVATPADLDAGDAVVHLFFYAELKPFAMGSLG